MKKLICPQCSITNLYVKNAHGEQLPVFVTSDYDIIAAKEGMSTQGFNLEVIYCFGCSWKGTPKKLKSIFTH
ncbi:MAG: hypothetical protein RSB93_04940 [Rikenellaceae bacterium]